MIPELGHYALILALGLALIQGIFFIGKYLESQPAPTIRR